MKLLLASSAVFSYKMWAIGIGMKLPGDLVADTLCSGMPVSNHMLVTRTTDGSGDGCG
jgi:hypothetical protein